MAAGWLPSPLELSDGQTNHLEDSMEQSVRTILDAPSRSSDNHTTLASVLERHRGERHIIVLQDYPDPDAIACAMAHRLISAKFDISNDIVYGGQISHQQNRALVKMFSVPLIAAKEEVDLTVYQGSVFVDGQGTSSVLTAKLRSARVPPIAVIDHHERQDQMPAAEFIDIRHAGATSTIYADYLRQGIIELDRNRREHVVIATALMHGIMTDTDQFVRASEEDFAAAAFLSQYHDPANLLDIMKQARSRQTMDTIQRALQNRILRENFSIAGIGYIRGADRDAIPQAADFLLTEENVHTAIVYGLVVGEQDGQRTETIIGSLRTTKLTLDPDQFIKEAFGRNPTGVFFGGGRSEAGGFEVPLGFLVGEGEEEYEKLKWQVYDMQIKQRLFSQIGIKS
jgi:nanoRNase/pAp phosphatase (c-di-AMP/oligoRNAs hydrolase)